MPHFYTHTAIWSETNMDICSCLWIIFLIVHKRLRQMSKNRGWISMFHFRMYKYIQNYWDAVWNFIIAYSPTFFWKWNALGSIYFAVSVAKGSKHVLIIEIHIFLQLREYLSRSINAKKYYKYCWCSNIMWLNNFYISMATPSRKFFVSDIACDFRGLTYTI